MKQLSDLIKNTSVILYPAIDIYQGKCVRLSQGRFTEAKTYFDNPLDAAKKWTDEGAQWLHIVDLDGARKGEPVNIKAIESIMTGVNVPVQIGGGIRNEDVADIFLTMGVARIVLGSAAFEDPDLVQILCAKYENRIALGVDARDGKVAIRGWEETRDRDPLSVAQEFEPMGPACVIFTEISQDGMLAGPKWESIERMVKGLSVPVIASGGISSVDDLRKLKEIGCDGAILGRALYEGKVDLKEALKATC